MGDDSKRNAQKLGGVEMINAISDEDFATWTDDGNCCAGELRSGALSSAEQGLGPQLREYENCFSAFTVLKDHFFGRDRKEDT